MYLIIFVTCPDGKSAEKIAEILLKKKIAACVNIIYAIKSIYRWKGKIEKGYEVLMIIKTKESLVEKITDIIAKNHPYNVPEIIAVPIISGSKKYLNWIKKETK